MGRVDTDGAESWMPTRDFVLLNLAYALCVMSSYFYSSLLPAIGTSFEISTSAVASLVSIAAIASGIGKFVLSVVVATLGAKPCFVIMLSCQALACGYLAVATKFSSVIVCALVSDVAVCILWPASVYIVQAISVSTTAHSQAIWGLGIASRVAAASAGPAFAALVVWVGWRGASALSILPCVVSAVCVCTIREKTAEAAPLTAHPAEAGSEEHNLNGGRTFACREAVSSMLKDGRVWICAGASSFFTGIKILDQTMVSLYLKDNAEHGLVSDAFAISLGPSFTIGVLFSVVFCGHLFTNVNARQKVALLTGLNCLSVACMLVIALDSALVAKSLIHVYIRCILLACAGLGLGLSLYQPVGIFALRVGGANSGLLAGALDGLSYVWSFVFVEAASHLLARQGGWTKVWWLCSVCYVIAALFTHSYVRHLFPVCEE